MGRMHLSDATLAALAYIATRMPATYAAIHASLAAAAQRLQDFAPASLLDVGAGPGTVLWAAQSVWPELQSAKLVEASASIRAVGQQLAAASGLQRIDWKDADIRRGVSNASPADLVTLAYVLDELEPAERGKLVDALWTAVARPARDRRARHDGRLAPHSRRARAVDRRRRAYHRALPACAGLPHRRT
jgi:ribosomal protein RSM22 (predicted rRNA methylase)